jgi:hypothetical protein
MLLALLNVITKYFYLQEVEEFSLIYFCLMGVVGIHITLVICIRAGYYIRGYRDLFIPCLGLVLICGILSCDAYKLG